MLFWMGVNMFNKKIVWIHHYPTIPLWFFLVFFPKSSRQQIKTMQIYLPTSQQTPKISPPKKSPRNFISILPQEKNQRLRTPS